MKIPPKLINTNPLSDCAIDHRPTSEPARSIYRACQIKLLRHNAEGEGFQRDQQIEDLFDYLPQDVDHCGVDHIGAIAQDLAKARIMDANAKHRANRSGNPLG